jgi:diguanylate cyclase (GGDEF)-like protein
VIRRLASIGAARPDDDRRTVARTAAGIYGGAMLIGLVEAPIPGKEHASLLPAVIAPVAMVLALVLGTRVPRRALVLFGPLGSVLVAIAVATTPGPGDGAVLYMWPAIWTAYFFGNRATVFIIAWTAIVHAVALWSMPDDLANVDRWIDVTAAVLVVTVLVRVLAERNARLVQRLAGEARLDPLTGLLNRRGLDERLAVELARAARESSHLAVASFDIDRFKSINDRHGHDVGDRVLTWVADVLMEQSRAVDIVARLGGDEFVVVLPGADSAEARSFAERVVAATGGSSSGVPVTVSGGVAAELAPTAAQPLLDAADRSLYLAKQAGRDTIGSAALLS